MDNLILMSKSFHEDLQSNVILEGFKLFISIYNEPISNFQLSNENGEGFLDLLDTQGTQDLGVVGFDFPDSRLLVVDMGDQVNSGSFGSCALFYKNLTEGETSEYKLAFYILLNQSYADSVLIQLIRNQFNIFSFDLSNINIRAKLLSYNNRSVSTHTHDLSLIHTITSCADALKFFDAYVESRPHLNVTFNPSESTEGKVLLDEGFVFRDGEEVIRDKNELNKNMITPKVQKALSKNMNEVYYVNNKSAIKLLGAEIPTLDTLNNNFIYFYKPNDTTLYKCSLLDFIRYLDGGEENV